MDRDTRILMNAKSFSTTDLRLRTSMPGVNDIAEGRLVVCLVGENVVLVTKVGRIMYKIPFHVAHAIPIEDNIESLIDSSGGTADKTVAAISGSGDDTDINNNFAELTGKVNSILSKLTEILVKFK